MENNLIEQSEKNENQSTISSENFIHEIINEDIKSSSYEFKIHTRFPPEPNGYLHIGHAKSICLNFGIAKKYNGICNLRFDDTNPSKEDIEYVDSIQEDIKWLGFDWEDRLFFASDYFDKLYDFAIKLIQIGKAFVCDLSADEIREYRGTLTKPGIESPYRDRSVEENLSLFEKMKNGEFPDGSKVLRLKIDMSSPNLNLRDPIIYRILRSTHHRTLDVWCIYPMYDYAHPISDSLEGITHSICTLEFEDHRPLYDLILETLDIFHSKQIEFARLNLNYTVMSKRKLLQLVNEGFVNGWNDPRMPTISGLRRRGFTPESIRNFCDRIGIAKRENIIDYSLLEYSLREDLNKKAKRVMAVLNPIKVIIDNFPDDNVEFLDALNNPEDLSMGSRKICFSKIIYIEKDDFKEIPPKKYFRLSPGSEVRLRYSYIITCNNIIKDKNGEVIEIHCSYYKESINSNFVPEKKVKGTIHWVSEYDGFLAEVRLYDRLFINENPGEGDKNFIDAINQNSLEVLTNCRLESCLKSARSEDIFQFERLGYFCVDQVDSNPAKLVFNRTVQLKDTWQKIEKAGKI